MPVLMALMASTKVWKMASAVGPNTSPMRISKAVMMASKVDSPCSVLMFCTMTMKPVTDLIASATDPPTIDARLVKPSWLLPTTPASTSREDDS